MFDALRKYVLPSSLKNDRFSLEVVVSKNRLLIKPIVTIGDDSWKEGR